MSAIYPMSPNGIRSTALFGWLALASACGGAAPSAESADDETVKLQAAHGKAAPSPHDELTASDVVIKLRGNETDIRRCFFANPNARGSLSLSWNVNTDGRINALDLGIIKGRLNRRLPTGEPAATARTLLFSAAAISQ